jgi:hypothetical protein
LFQRHLLEVRSDNQGRSKSVTEARSLESFVAALPVERKCWVCNVPEREEIDAAKRRGPYVNDKGELVKVTVPKTVAWLKARGHTDATPARINFHFQARHHAL